MNDLYSIKDVAQIFDLEISRLRYWAQTGFVNPSVRRGARVYYTFQDLVAVRTAKDLLDAGLSMQKVRKNLDSLRQFLPEVSRPASRMRIVSDGETVVALDRGTAFEPTSGQVVMSFALDALSSAVADVLALPTPIMAHELPAQEPVESSADEAAQDAADSEPRLADELRETDQYIDADGASDGTDSDELDHADQADTPLATVHLLKPDLAGAREQPVPSGSEKEAAADSKPMAKTALATDGHASGMRDEPESAHIADVIDAQIAADTPSASGYQCFVLACEAEDQGEIDDAEALYREAIVRDPSLSAAYTNLGNLLYRGGDLAQARGAYEHALELEPAQAEARFNLGNVLEDLGETDQAIAELRRVCWTHPDFAEAHYNLGLVLARIGGLTQARQHLERYLALETDPENGWVERARTFLHSLSGARVAVASSRSSKSPQMAQPADYSWQ